MVEVKKLVSLKEASKELSITSKHLNYLINNNDFIGVFKIGGRWKIDLSTFKMNFTDSAKSNIKVSFEKLRHYFETESAYWLSIQPNTASNARKALREASTYFYNKEFSRENLELWKNELKIQRLADGTISKYINTLSKMCQECIKVGIATSNPCEGLKKDLKVVIRDVFLTEDERKRLLSVCHEDLADQINFAIETGLRQGEQFGLTWDKVFFKQKEVLINETVRRDTTKNGKARIVPLSPPALEILKKRRHLSKPFDKYVSTHYKDALKKAGITRRVTWHDLRRTFGMWCIKGWHHWIKGQNYNKDIIRFYLGHMSDDAVDSYAKLDTADLHRLIEQELYQDN